MLTQDSVARIRRFGITGLKIDDYIMFNGVVCKLTYPPAIKASTRAFARSSLVKMHIDFGVGYTILCISFNKVINGGGSNYMTDEEVAALTPLIIEERIRGSKWVFVTEHAMLIAIWSMKACMIVLYRSIT